jgi:hypothetical protein
MNVFEINWPASETTPRFWERRRVLVFPPKSLFLFALRGCGLRFIRLGGMLKKRDVGLICESLEMP